MSEQKKKKNVWFIIDNTPVLLVGVHRVKRWRKAQKWESVKGRYVENYRTKNGAEYPVEKCKETLTDAEKASVVRWWRSEKEAQIQWDVAKDTSLSVQAVKWMEQLTQKTDDEIFDDYICFKTKTGVYSWR